MFQQRFDYIRLPRQIADAIHLDETSIKVGTGVNAIRKIYKDQEYDQFEKMQISKLAQELQKMQKYDANAHTDDILLRYLYGNKFDITLSAEQLVQAADILFQPGYLQLDRDIESLYVIQFNKQQKGALYIEGRTREHKPCIVVSTKLVDDLNLFERAAVLLCAIVEDYMFYSGKVESWIAVIQTKDQSAYKMPLDRIFQIIKILQICFPNTCEAVYILNATLSINLLWSQVEEIISPLTLNKIKFLKDKELPILSNQFHPESLEQSLGGEKIIQSYWPPDPNDYMYELPPTQQLPIQFEEESQVYYQQPQSNIQYLNSAPVFIEEQPPQVIEQPQPVKQAIFEPVAPVQEKKKKCICVKCSKDLDEANSQPRPPKEPKVNQPPPPPAEKPNIPIEIMQTQQLPSNSQRQLRLDDTYVSYQRKYDSFIDESNLLIPNPNNNDTIIQDFKEPIQPEQQFGGNSFNSTPQIQAKPSKPSFTNPLFNPELQASQTIEPKQQPVISNKVSQEIQANMDDTIIDQPEYQPKYVSKHSRPYNQSNYQQSQSSRLTNNLNFQNLPSYNPNNPYPISQFAPTIQTFPPSQQYIPIPIDPLKQDILQQPVQVQEFDTYNPQTSVNPPANQPYNPQASYYAPQLSNDPKRKYDFSQWDKYNDLNDPYPTQTYTPSTYVPQTYVPTTTPYQAPEEYNQMYDNTSDYKPGEFRPSTYNFTPYDYRYSDQQYQPKVESTVKSNTKQQLYQQKPGQQACQIF